MNTTDTDDDDADDDADDDDDASMYPSLLSDKHRILQLRLGPLRQVQRDLERSLGAGSTEAPEFAGDAAPWAFLSGAGHRPREFCITSRTGWKTALKRVKSSYGAISRTSLGSRDEARIEMGSVEEANFRKKVGQYIYYVVLSRKSRSDSYYI